jgi:FAD/FMN-containing dehydrogenase
MKMNRRGFVHSTLAATTAALLPLRSLWAGDAVPGSLPATLAAIGGSGRPVSLTGSDLKDLRSSLRGRLLLPHDAGYDQARRYWDAAFDPHPGLIVQPANAQDVIRAVQFARAHDLLTAVRGGGHCQVAQIAACDGALMIDLSLMRTVQVDAQRQRVKADGGVLLGEIDRATQAIGLATTLGTATDTGIAGLTLGGGLGRLMRTFGLACDNLVSVDIVTAEGRLWHASERENPDLFWAVRGGGGNFGVLTAFEYQLHPFAHQVLAAHRLYPYDRAHTVLQAVTQLAAQIPDELTLGVELSSDERGRFVHWSAFYSGDPREGEHLLEPLKKLGAPLQESLSAESYLAAQGAGGNGPIAVPKGPAGFEKSGYVHGAPSDALFDELVRRFQSVPAALHCSASLGQMGGAVARVKPEATAYWNRTASFTIIAGDTWSGRLQPEADRNAFREVWHGVEPFTKGYYINGDSEVQDQRLRITYGENYPRLVKLKTQYDPTNLFKLNANIRPALA